MSRQSSRREFLKHSAALATTVALPMPLLSLGCAVRRGYRPQQVSGYGPLRAVADQTTGLELLRLPEGFTYRSFHWSGDEMTDGHRCPDAHDGMGMVRAEGDILTLVRNHERRGSDGSIGNPDHAYDVTGGGTTTFRFNTRTGESEDSWVSLSGTLHNCAGGVTPWGTWLSCEEGPFTPKLARIHRPDVLSAWGLENAGRRHGWVFEVPADGVAAPEPLRQMGQFFHEATAVDPETGIVYMTEDRFPDAGFYRFIPEKPGDLKQGGRLQAMRVVGWPEWKAGGEQGRPYAVEWVDIADPEQGHSPGSHDFGGVITQGMAGGATAFIALEGCCFHSGQVMFTSKAGGAAECGQIFAFDISNQTIRLLLDAPSNLVLNGPDNLTTTLSGDLLICEDPVADSDQSARLVALTPEGDYHYVGEVNPAVAGTVRGQQLADSVPASEWAGASFSPDGQWLLVNLQEPGVTLAITGPWADLRA